MQLGMTETRSGWGDEAAALESPTSLPPHVGSYSLGHDCA
jgi:hypothetical protein